MKSIKKIRKKVTRQSLWEKLVFKYNISVVNENELKEVANVKFSRMRFILLLLLYTALVVTLSIVLYNRTPQQKQNTYQDNLMRQTIIDEALRIDSLEYVVNLQNHYITNIQDIFAGNINLDTVYSVDSLTIVRSEQLMEKTAQEDAFVKSFEEAERYNVTSPIPTGAKLQSLNMIRPTIGLVTQHFNPTDNHRGVDIAANPQESVLAVMDGTVVVSAYTSDAGHVICLSHPGGLVSIYKHCESLLKQQGDKVKQGDVIALVSANQSAYHTNPHLHFELWYEGQPLDPEKYILF
ncbi:MAG: M23 family metallopeptidase [Bacteroidaceae bacterium]|nr:M23 family metallopeptidase [Bacteroidaceae bacterium]